jgi:hypothetical protein
MAAMIRCVELCRELGNSPLLRPFVKREAMPSITTGNTMVPCLLIGERAADRIKASWNLGGA